MPPRTLLKCCSSLSKSELRKLALVNRRALLCSLGWFRKLEKVNFFSLCLKPCSHETLSDTQSKNVQMTSLLEKIVELSLDPIIKLRHCNPYT